MVKAGDEYQVVVSGISCRSGYVHLKGDILLVCSATNDNPNGELGPRGFNWYVQTKHDYSVWATLESCIARGLVRKV